MNSTPKTVLVLGASLKPDRISRQAVERLAAAGHEVLAYGMQAGMIGPIPITNELKAYDAVDTVTLYLNPTNQKPLYSYILGIKPARVIFNPGTENPELQHLLMKAGILFEESCTLVMLRTGAF